MTHHNFIVDKELGLISVCRCLCRLLSNLGMLVFLTHSAAAYAIGMPSDVHIAENWPTLHQDIVAAKIDPSKPLAAKYKPDLRILTNDKYAYSALHLATHFGYYGLMAKLIAEGADPNAKGSSPEELSVLHMAVTQSDGIALKTLIDAGARVDIETDIGLLDLSAMFNPCKMFRYLVDAFNNQSTSAVVGEVAFTYVLKQNDLQRLLCILDSDVEKRFKMKNGDTIMHYAARNGFVSALAILADQIDLSAVRNSNGESLTDVASTAMRERHFERLGID